MSNLVFDSLSQLDALLFRNEDSLSLAQGQTGLAVTSSGVTTTLSSLGGSLVFPSGDLSEASLAGNVTFPDSTLLMVGTNSPQDIAAGDHAAVIYALDGDDHVYTGDNPGYVYGGGGSDSIQGGNGNDHLFGYGSQAGMDGADTISGGGGGDYIQGNAGNDQLDGGEGDDRIFGGADNDTIHGSGGNDAINGNYGSDVINGDDGDDVVRGGKADDMVAGGSGNDQVYGDLGADRLTGGSGADLFHFSGNDAAFLSTDLLTGHVDTITDYAPGEDHITLGFRPTEVLYESGQSSPALALTYVTSLLANHGADVVAVGVGNDTYLFYSSTGGSVADSVIDLQGVSASSITVQDFV